MKFWFKSQTDVTAPIIKSYSVIQNKPNLGYFTQLAWAKSHKMGKLNFMTKLIQLC